MLGRAWIGAPLGAFVAAVKGASGSEKLTDNALEQVLRGHEEEQHVLFWSWRQKAAWILLKEGVTSEGQLKAWAHALYVARECARTESGGDAPILKMIEEALAAVNRRWKRKVKALKAGGWEPDIASLETVPGTRIRVRQG